MRVLRHEEFEEACEASCNGPYSGYWSKTMIGNDNEDNSFVFELTYNYGIETYKRGNDLHSIQIYKTNSEGVDLEEKLNKDFPDAKDTIVDGVYNFCNGDFML